MGYRDGNFKFLMQLQIYPLLSTNSKRAMRRIKKTHQGYYGYFPRYKLLNRLCAELSMAESEVLIQIQKEREFLLKEQHGNLYPQ